MSKCKHEILSVKRRASGIHLYTYTRGSNSPWCFEDDEGNLSIPKFGFCLDCGERVRLPDEAHE